MPLGRRRASSPSRRRFGYDGCGTDLFALVVLIGLGLWGVRSWNYRDSRPFNLPRIPVPRVIQRIPGWRPAGMTPAPTAPRPAPTPAAQRPISSPTPAAPPSAPPATPAPPPTPDAEPTPAEEATPSPAPPEKLTVTKLAPRVSPSADPFGAAATAVHVRGAKVYLGLPDGGIAIADKGAKGGMAVRLPQNAGPVRALAAGGDGAVYWLATNDARLYAYRPTDKSLRAFDLPPEMSASAVASFPGPEGEVVAVLGEGAGGFLDPKDGTVLEPAVVLPEEAAAAVGRPATSLFFATDPAGKAGTALLVVSGDGVAPGTPANLGLWHTAGKATPDAWERVPVDAAGVPAYSTLLLKEASGRAAVSLTPTSAALLAKPVGGQTLAAGQVWSASWRPTGDAAPEAQPVGTLPEGVFGLWTLPERVSAGKSGLWWVLGGSVFHAAKPGATAEVYLPWNGAGNKQVSALLADDDGAWVATEKGVHHIVPTKASEKNGFGGFIRAKLGTDFGKPPANPLAQKLDRMTQEWKGTPYLWGGNGKAGVDCSGYVSALYHELGVSLPRSTKELATLTSGKRIRDELKYGDVLIFPGHCAVYTGNGFTSEAMTTEGVNQAAIWARKEVIVRRFVKM